MTYSFAQPSGLSEIIDQYDVIFCDVWGVIHNGRRAFRGACDALVKARQSGVPVVLITNAPVAAQHVESVFEPVGVPKEAYHAIASSGDATRAELFARTPGPAYRLGTDEGWEKDDTLFEGVGLEFLPDEKASEAAFIIAMGLRDQFNDHPDDYKDELTELAAKKIPFICANPDIQVRVGNNLMWCAGALARIYERAGGPVIYPGKPFSPIYDLARTLMVQLRPDLEGEARILCIGDGPGTDIKGANMQGLDSLYVGSGLAQGMEGAFAHETSRFLDQYGVSATYAMPELVW